jgi:UDP-glucose 4-epimerase
MATALVTGGAGFIGSHVAAHLLNEGHDVVVLDDLSGGSADYVPNGARFVEGSILNVALVDELFSKHRFNYVYHLAAYAAEGLSHFIRRFNYTNNVVGSVNLINAAVNWGTECFVFTSSIAAYGPVPVPMREDMHPQPEDPYGIAKFAVEMDLKAAHEMFGLEYVIFRPHNVYGEHQNIGDRYRNVIGIFMNQIMSGDPLTIFGDGEQTRAFSYIGDVAPVIARSVHVPAARGGVFNIGADKPYTVNELAYEVCKAMGAEPRVQHLPARNEVKDAYASHERVKQVFRHEARYSLSDGIARMAEWALKAGPRQSKAFQGIEVTRNLPSAWVREAEPQEATVA